MTAGFQTECTMADPVRCVWKSELRPSLFLAARALLLHRNGAHAHGAPWTMSYQLPGEPRTVVLP